MLAGKVLNVLNAEPSQCLERLNLLKLNPPKVQWFYDCIENFGLLKAETFPDLNHLTLNVFDVIHWNLFFCSPAFSLMLIDTLKSWTELSALKERLHLGIYNEDYT